MRATLPLTFGAEERRATALDDAAHATLTTTRNTRGSLAAIDGERLLKCTDRAVRVTVVTQ